MTILSCCGSPLPDFRLCQNVLLKGWNKSTLPSRYTITFKRLFINVNNVYIMNLHKNVTKKRVLLREMSEGGTWSMFRYRGAAGGLKSWSFCDKNNLKYLPCKGQPPSHRANIYPWKWSCVDRWPAKFIDEWLFFRIASTHSTTVLLACLKFYTLFWTERPKPSLSSGTSPYRPYVGVLQPPNLPPPPQRK